MGANSWTEIFYRMCGPAISILVGILLLVSPIVCFAGEKEVDVNGFWQRFRNAVILERYEDIGTLTHFPFEVRGAVDGDPVVRYDRKHFPSIFKRLCYQHVEAPTGRGFVDKTMAEVIKDKRSLGPRDFLTSDSIRVNQFLFKRVNGQWLFIRGYLEE